MSGSKLEKAPPQSPSPTAAGLFVLPIEIRHDIFKRVLAVSDPLYLFQDPGGPVKFFMPSTYKPYAWLALLYTSRQVSYEARAVLYGVNRFILEEVELANYRGKLLNSFITCIGSVNAGFLSHLRITFPATERIDGQSGEIRLTEDSLQDLRLLQNECTKLTTLDVLVYSQSSSYLITEDQDNPEFARDVLLKINAEFRCIPSLARIILRVYSGSPASSMKAFLNGLGWVVLIGDR